MRRGPTRNRTSSIASPESGLPDSRTSAPSESRQGSRRCFRAYPMGIFPRSSISGARASRPVAVFGCAGSLNGLFALLLGEDSFHLPLVLVYEIIHLLLLAGGRPGHVFGRLHDVGRQEDQKVRL